MPLEGLRERFLPECSFRGRQNAKLQYTVLVAPAVHGGTEPDLLDEFALWQTGDFWQYAMYAAVAYVRPPPAGRASGCAIHARTLMSTLTILLDNAEYLRLTPRMPSCGT